MPGPRMFPVSDPTGSKLVERYYNEIMRQYQTMLDMLYPEIEPGVRVPAFHNKLPDEIIHFRLEEVARRSLLVEQGQLDPDEETKRFMDNEDGAQQKLLELRSRYTAPQEAADVRTERPA